MSSSLTTGTSQSDVDDGLSFRFHHVHVASRLPLPSLPRARPRVGRRSRRRYMRQGLRGESARQLLWRALGRGAPGSTANASPVVSRLASLASKNAPGASPSASAAHDMPAHALAGPSVARCAHTAARGCFADHPRAWRLPARVPHRRVSHRPVAAAAASSADVDDVDDVDSEASSTSSPLASASGVVVTSQANFLRVVVRPRDMSPGQIANREAQLSRAMARAEAAGETEDVNALRERIDDSSGPYELLCVVRALLKKIKRRVLVGDDVTVTGVDWVDNRAMVHDVAPRRSRLTDPPVANVDRALLVFALERPPLEAKQLTRFLVSMEHTKVPFDLVLNKSDLVDEVTKADWNARLEQWGYKPRFVSVATGEGVRELEADLARVREDDDDDDGESRESHTTFRDDRTRVTVLAGPSGVGKSSLINRLRAGSALAEALAEAGELDEADEANDAFGLDSGVASDAEDSEDSRSGDDRRLTTSPLSAESGESVEKNVYVTDVDISGGGGGARGAVNLRMAAGVELQSVKAVSAKLGRGRHTTRHVTLLPLKSGGLLADTPGFGYPSLEGVTIDELTSGSLFPEIAYARRLEGRCKFADCTHRDEPGCAVDSLMPWEEERYDMYCDVFDEVEAAEKATKAAGYKRETRVRYKDGSVSTKKPHSTKKQRSDDESRDDENREEAKKTEKAQTEKNRDGDANRRRRVNRRMEPKLETKSARRQSRRAFNMETAEMEAFGDGEDSFEEEEEKA